ncbi:MAG: hypothetical protein HY243_12570 [Proteobacteria bacterium]|nr:hypothetical protein [Pseudomonadota bacterium]
MSSTDRDTAIESKIALHGIPHYLPKTVLPFNLKGVTFDKDGNPAKTDKKGKSNATGYKFMLTLDKPTQVADGDARVLLVYNTEAATEDNFNFAVNDKGLLTSAKLQSEDKSAAAIASIADLAGRFASTSAAPSQLFMQLVRPRNPKKTSCQEVLKSFEYSGFFDLTNGTSSRDANEGVLQAMQNAGIPVAENSAVMDVSVSATKPWADAGADTVKNVSSNARGIVFRAWGPRTVTVTVAPANIHFQPEVDCHLEQPSKAVTLEGVAVADKDRYFTIDTSRGALVKKIVNLTVTDGLLTGVDVTKPSELAAVFAIPASVIDTFTKAVLGNLTTRTTLTQDEVALLQAQVSLINQQQALVAAQQAAEKAKAQDPQKP